MNQFDLKCPACKSRQQVLIHLNDELVYSKCKVCSHFLNYVSPDQLKSYYLFEQSKFYDTNSLVLSPIFKLMEFEAINNRTKILNTILKEPRKVVEVGPGNGSLLHILKNSGHSIYASEQSSVLAQNLSILPHENVFVGEFESNTNIPSDFDAIVSFHVIEHVIDPETFLRKAFDITVPGGYLILATPNADSWHHRFPFNLSSNYDSAHLHVFSKKSLTTLATEAGWKVDNIITPSYSVSLPRLITSFIRKYIKKKSASAGGAYVANFNPKLILFYKYYSNLSRPFRKIQELLGVGNEIILVAKKEK